MLRESKGSGRPFYGRNLATALASAPLRKFGTKRAETAAAHEQEVAREMELLARASQSIAHDLRNVFSVVKACAVDLYDEMHGRKAGALVLEILNAAERGLTATTDLMKAGRMPFDDDRPVDIRLHTSELEPILRRLATPAVTLEMACDGKPSFARIDGTSILQILVNLVDNASDALRRQGTIRVECGQRLRTPEIGLVPVPVAFISVSDDGPGIAPDVIERIFETGFSTKAGTHCGLGLALVQRVVERCHGWIEVQSVLGEGTSFLVEFPLVEPTDSGLGLVVVADDQARQLLVEELQEQGFVVVAAADALEACDLMLGGTIADIAMLDAVSAADRGLWHMARLHHVTRVAAVGEGPGLLPLPTTRGEGKALLDGCTSATVQSPVLPPPATPWQVIPHQ